jgi:hypothetical protein
MSDGDLVDAYVGFLRSPVKRYVERYEHDIVCAAVRLGELGDGRAIEALPALKVLEQEIQRERPTVDELQGSYDYGMWWETVVNPNLTALRNAIVVVADLRSTGSQAH